MKIFITGIAGFLGSHLAERMLLLGHEVLGNDSLVGGYEDNIPKGAKFFNIDCCDHNEMVKELKGVDVVYHTAATAHEGLSVFSPNFITKNIFQASVSTISAAIQNKVKRFVYCSSMARYGNQNYPFTEDMKPAPVDPYGIAKVAGEDVLKTLAELNGMEWIIAVPHNIIGPKQNYEDPFRNVVSIMINRVLQGKSPIIYGDGTQKRCFSYIDDCIYCLEKLALDSNIRNDIFNIGPDEEFVTINEMANLIIEKLQFSQGPIYVKERPKEVKYATCSSEKARTQLGYKTSTTFDLAIDHAIDYIKSRGTRPFKYEYPLEIVNDLTPKVWVERLM